MVGVVGVVGVTAVWGCWLFAVDSVVGLSVGGVVGSAFNNCN